MSSSINHEAAVDLARQEIDEAVAEQWRKLYEAEYEGAYESEYEDAYEAEIEAGTDPAEAEDPAMSDAEYEAKQRATVRLIHLRTELTDSMISSADLVQRNGVGCWLWISRYSRTAFSNAGTERCVPRRNCCSVSAAKKRSTKLIHEL